jgi:hypothetical protein
VVVDAAWPMVWVEAVSVRLYTRQPLIQCGGAAFLIGYLFAVENQCQVTTASIILLVVSGTYNSVVFPSYHLQ